MEAYNKNLKICITVMMAIVAVKLKTKRRNRRIQAKRWLNRRNQGRGVLNMLEHELLQEDVNAYVNYLRMAPAKFNVLVNAIRADVGKSNTNMRECISVEKRLAVTLRFLATGETYRSLMYATRIHESTISIIVPEVCKSLYKHLKDVYLKIPNSQDEWRSISEDFFNIWQFPNYLGAMDGKHIQFRPPRSAGSYYFNYKKQHSIVLLALVDANYKFLYIDVGVNGRVSVGGVFRESSLANAIKLNTLNFPSADVLPGQLNPAPYVIIADDAFPLSTQILKPYPQRDLSREKRQFNYRLSRARRVVENAFGILANRFRILLSILNLDPNKVEIITLTCCALHNYLCSNSKAQYVDIKEEGQLNSVNRQVGNKTGRSAMLTREQFKDYFNSEEAVVA